MKGRKPKEPGLRARRNKAATAVTLEPPPEAPRPQKTPPLPRGMFPCGRCGAAAVAHSSAISQPGTEKTDRCSEFQPAVHPLTRQWWREVWRTPMAGRYIETDVLGIRAIAILWNQVYMEPGSDRVPRLMAEIRQQEGRFGLDVLGRRRLDWRIEGSPKGGQAPATPPPAASAREVAEDPRRLLRAVK